MTNAQRFISKYIDQNISGSVKKEFKDDGTVKITDKHGESMSFTCNLFGDIMDAKTKNILAESNLPHDLDKLNPGAVPTSWRNLPHPGKPLAETALEKSVRAKLLFLQSQKEKEQRKGDILRKAEREV